MKFIDSSAGPTKRTAYYRQKLAYFGRQKAAAEKLMAERPGTPEAEAAGRRLDIVINARIRWAEERLASALRQEMKAVGALACRQGASVRDCPIHASLPEKERLFCAWCAGWWDERYPPAKGRRKK